MITFILALVVIRAGSVRPPLPKRQAHVLMQACGDCDCIHCICVGLTINHIVFSSADLPSLQTKRQPFILIFTALFLAGNICVVYYTFWDKHLYNWWVLN